MVGFLGLPEPSIRDPWRCTSCLRLMFNKDPRGYPCHGAPVPLWVDNTHPTVCSLCYEMHAALDKADWTYWSSVPKDKFIKLEPDRFERH